MSAGWECVSCGWENVLDTECCANCSYNRGAHLSEDLGAEASAPPTASGESSEQPAGGYLVALASKPALTRIQQAIVLLTAEATACLGADVPTVRGVQRNERVMKIVRALMRQNVLDLQISPEESDESRGVVMRGNICGPRDMDEGFEEPFPFERGVMNPPRFPMMPLGVGFGGQHTDRDYATEAQIADLQLKASQSRQAEAQARVHELDGLARLIGLKLNLSAVSHTAGVEILTARIDQILKKIGAPHDLVGPVSPTPPADPHLVPADDVR